jgi:hypothetical protein
MNTHAATTLRSKWAALPGVTFPTEAAATPRTPRTSPRRTPANPSHRCRRYLAHPDLYTARGTRRRYPIGTPADPQWVDSAAALAILGLSRARLWYYAKKFNVATCRYSDPKNPQHIRIYYRESELLAILPHIHGRTGRPPRSK